MIYTGYGAVSPNVSTPVKNGVGGDMTIAPGLALMLTLQHVSGSVNVAAAVKVGSTYHGQQTVSDEATGYDGDGSTLSFAGQVLDNLPIAPGSVTVTTNSPAVTQQPTNVTGVVIESASSDSPVGSDGQLIFNVAVAEETDVTVLAAASMSSGDYWLLYAQDGTKYYVWYNIAAAGNDPQVPGFTGVAVAVGGADNADAVRDATITAVDALTDISSSNGGSAIVTVTQDNVGIATAIADGNAGVSPSIGTTGEDHTLAWEAPTEVTPGTAVSVMIDGLFTLIADGGSSISVTVTVASYDAADQTDSDITIAATDSAPDLIDNGDGTLTAVGSASVGTINYFTGALGLTYDTGEAPAPGSIVADYVQGNLLKPGGTHIVTPATLTADKRGEAIVELTGNGGPGSVAVEAYVPPSRV